MNALRRERMRRGLTQLALAIRAGCSLNSISIAERGGRLSRPMAERLARVLEVNSDHLLSGAPRATAAGRDALAASLHGDPRELEQPVADGKRVGGA